jgi:hypothetical protein
VIYVGLLVTGSSVLIEFGYGIVGVDQASAHGESTLQAWIEPRYAQEMCCCEKIGHIFVAT